MREDSTKPAPDPELRRARGLAAASLVCGAASLFLLSRLPPLLLVLLAILAIVCGQWARHRLAKNPRSTADSACALAGLLLAYVGIGACLFSSMGVTAGEIEKARRINCAANLKQIGLACKKCAGEHHGAFPPDWKILWDKKYLDVQKIYICPSTNSTPPTDSAQLLDPKHCDYVYFGAGQTDIGPPGATTVLAADRTGNHRGFWNVIFGDGHVDGVFAAPGTDFATAVRQKGWILPGAAKKP